MNPVAGLKIERALICSMWGRSRVLADRGALPENTHQFYRPRPLLREVSTMKFGMNLLLWTGHVTQEHFPLLAQLKRAGYDGVELPLFEGDAAHYRTVAQ